MMQVGKPTAMEAQQMGSSSNDRDKVLVCNMTASGNKQLLLDLGSNNITAVAVGELPHTRATRAMDVQSALSVRIASFARRTTASL
mmetsp:Transcript_31600/g.78271  ORF Transcript_31600/g.78271 Transcript_31600/m.78271 type:complete len:86 (-) Transcript_31600:6-263(-)